MGIWGLLGLVGGAYSLNKGVSMRKSVRIIFRFVCPFIPFLFHCTSLVGRYDYLQRLRLDALIAHCKNLHHTALRHHTAVFPTHLRDQMLSCGKVGRLLGLQSARIPQPYPQAPGFFFLVCSILPHSYLELDSKRKCVNGVPFCFLFYAFRSVLFRSAGGR